MKTRILTLATAAAVLFTAHSAVAAGSKATTFNVSSSVAANCTISATDLNFGAYDPVVANKTTALDVNTTVSVLCTKGSTGVTVGLDLGTHAAAGNRFMSNGSDSLQYELYSDSAGGAVWSNGGAGVVAWPVFGPIGAGTGTPHTVFGRVPAAQDVSVGSYTDVVTATVNF
ncbi:MAG: spore coat U domain-containing protein [Myxococcales bacterium]